MGHATRKRVCGVNHYEPSEATSKEVLDALEELTDMGLVEIVGITDDGQWLYGPTDAGKRAVQIWEN